MTRSRLPGQNARHCEIHQGDANSGGLTVIAQVQLGVNAAALPLHSLSVAGEQLVLKEAYRNRKPDGFLSPETAAMRRISRFSGRRFRRGRL